jgi:hypothetical protein
MKKIFAGIAFLGLVAFASAQTIKYDKETIDYGSIAQGSNGERQFTFTNTGDKPLIVSKVESSCGCTVPKWSNEPIAPGKTGMITVSYDTKRPGMIAKTITVISNDPVNGRSVLHIKGNVEGASAVDAVELRTAQPAETPAPQKAMRAEARKAELQSATAVSATLAPATAERAARAK